MAYGVKDIVLDPGTFINEGLPDTINNFTMLRRAATKGGEELAGLPLLGIPMVAWVDKGETADDLIKWREAYVASMLVVRYADVLIMHGNDGWALLPMTVLRQNIYTDPRKPVAVAPGLKVYGTPDENSPVMFTSNFALTYYTVASDIESKQTQRLPNRRRNRRLSNRQRSRRTQTHSRKSRRSNQSQRHRTESQTPQNHHPRQSLTHQRRNRRTQRLESPSWTTRQQRDTQVSH